MTAHQFKVGDRVEVVAPDSSNGWQYIKGRGTGTIMEVSDIDNDFCVFMDDAALMKDGFDAQKPVGWFISASSLRPLSPPAPDRLTATALELAEAVDATNWDDDENYHCARHNKRFADALRAYREARRTDPRARLRALIEQHGGDDREALLAVLDPPT